jgi:aspartokinase/homoserine dehydrogenase 1
VREQDLDHCLKLLCDEFGGNISSACEGGSEGGSEGGTASRKLSSNGYQLGTKEKVSTVSVVGVPGWNETGIVAHTFAALGKYGTRVIAVAQAASEFSVSFCIPEDQVNETVRFLHRELGLE